MKKSMLLILALMSGYSVADMDQHAAQGRVVSATERAETRFVQYDRCTPVKEQREISSGNSTAGTILGGIVGGVVGHQVGKGRGNDVATAAGAVIGAFAGKELASDDMPRYEERLVNKCSKAEREEQVVTGYDVTYEYAGVRYYTFMKNRPGRYINISVSVVPTEN